MSPDRRQNGFVCPGCLHPDNLSKQQCPVCGRHMQEVVDFQRWERELQ